LYLQEVRVKFVYKGHRISGQSHRHQQRPKSLRTDTMVRVWVAGKTMWSHCYTRAVSDFSLLSCMTAY